MGKLIISENELRHIKNLYNGLLFEQTENDGRLRIDFGADFQQGKYDVKSLNVTEVYKKLEPLKKFFSDNEGGDIKLYIESSESNSTPPPGMKDGDLSKYRLQTIKSVVEGWLNKSIPDWKNNATIEEYIVKPEERQEKYTRGVDKATDPKYLADQYVYMEVSVDQTLKPLQPKTTKLPTPKERNYIPPGTKIENFGGDIITLECDNTYEVTGKGAQVGDPPFIGFQRKINVRDYDSLTVSFNSLRIPDRFIITDLFNNVLLDTGFIGSPNNQEVFQFHNLLIKHPNQTAFKGVNFGNLKPVKDLGNLTKFFSYVNTMSKGSVKFDTNYEDHVTSFNISSLKNVSTIILTSYSPLKNTLFTLKFNCQKK